MSIDIAWQRYMPTSCRKTRTRRGLAKVRGLNAEDVSEGDEGADRRGDGGHDETQDVHAVALPKIRADLGREGAVGHGDDRREDAAREDIGAATAGLMPATSVRKMR